MHRYSSFLGLDLPGVSRHSSLVSTWDLCGACCALVSDIWGLKSPYISQYCCLGYELVLFSICELIFITDCVELRDASFYTFESTIFRSWGSFSAKLWRKKPQKRTRLRGKICLDQDAIMRWRSHVVQDCRDRDAVSVKRRVVYGFCQNLRQGVSNIWG